MRHTPLFDVTDLPTIHALIDANPWATLVSGRSDGTLAASHYPVLRDPEAGADRTVLLTHIGMPDDAVLELRAAPLLVIFQAAQHGYISPSWYGEEDAPVPTWNFSAVHCTGTPQVLSENENLAVLARLTEHFEQHVSGRRHLEPELARRIASRTVGLRIPVDTVTCKVKMSQNKSEATQRSVIAALERDGEPYADPALAAEMRRVLGR